MKIEKSTTYTVYKWHKAGIDGPTGEVESWSAAAALEQFAAENGIADGWSLDQTRSDDRARVWLCPKYGQPAFFYAYA